ncbi:DNA/RNA nuclease SfsA [Campylobacter sp. RM16190]|uniref:DNA/RNA nuclease SfsA n=1 Tax=Campylobacter sp. RM16190 TaxID=1705727 RepID=UPI001472A7F7|nr:DNA/RNA nuclease SfsA [Campylobacter sp. RM16190]
MTKQTKYINAIQKDKSAKAKFAYEVAKRESKGLSELEATYQAGYQAYCAFNYYAKECEYLEKQNEHLKGLIDKLEQAKPKGVYKWHGGLSQAR